MDTILIVLHKAIKTGHSTQPVAWPATGWPLSGSTQPGSLISEPTKLEPDPTHHGLAG